MPAISIRLPDDLSERLQKLAERTGRTKTFYVVEAIQEHLDEIEDIYIAEKRLIDIRAGRSRTYTLEEVERSEVLLHVQDAASPMREEQKAQVEKVLAELKTAACLLDCNHSSSKVPDLASAEIQVERGVASNEFDGTGNGAS